MHFLLNAKLTSFLLLLLLCFSGLRTIEAQEYPPLLVEISSEHPLLVFQKTDQSGASPERYAEALQAAWETLPERIRPMSVLLVDVGVGHGRHERYETLLQRMQEWDIPVVIRLGAGADRYPPEALETLLRTYTIVRGVEAPGLQFNIYDAPTPAEQWGPPAHIPWLEETIDLVARYGRFTLLPLDELHWARLMANQNTRSLYERIAEAAGYVIPVAQYRGDHQIGQISAMLGAWLEGSLAYWGVAPDARWYDDAHFRGLGRFGGEALDTTMPPALYRAMLLNGAMTGATVYTFYHEGHQWAEEASPHWEEAIYPTLTEILDNGFIARKDFVLRETPVALQLRAAGTPQDFHRNLRDLDGVLDQGLLMHAAYGMERPGQVPELIPNQGRYFWTPVLSAHRGNAAHNQFKEVVEAGSLENRSDWQEILNAHHDAVGEGNAFITSVGRGAFVMNTRENVQERQSFRVEAVPAPVHSIEAQRMGDGVELRWPFREGDVSFKVFRRFPPEPEWKLLESGVTENRFTDPAVGPSDAVAYTVTALTNEQAPYEGTVGHGEYLALSVVESRMDHEVVLNAVMNFGESRPILTTLDYEPEEPWWPSFEGAEDGARREIAETIVSRIERWEEALQARDLEGVLNHYAAAYEDPQGWGFEYVQRAYQWLFERYRGLRMHRQIRRWDFSSYEYTGQVNVLMYCSLQGHALSDPTGRIADQPIALPRPEYAEIWITWEEQEQNWRIVQTNPALPNFKELLQYSTGPYDGFGPGPDEYVPEK